MVVAAWLQAYGHLLDFFSGHIKEEEVFSNKEEKIIMKEVLSDPV